MRKDQGKRTVLARHKDSLREKLNIQRCFLMDEAMKAVLGMDEKDLFNTICQKQLNIVQNERQQRRNTVKVPKLESSRYKLICGKCGKFRVDCSLLRCVKGAHYVIIDKGIWNRLKTVPFPKEPPRFDSEIILQGQLQSNSDGCTHAVGTTFSYNGTRLPALSHKYMKVLDTEKLKENISKIGKWPLAPFSVQDISDADLQEMQ